MQMRQVLAFEKWTDVSHMLLDIQKQASFIASNDAKASKKVHFLNKYIESAFLLILGMFTWNTKFIWEQIMSHSTVKMT